MKRQRGFSMIELVIVVAVIAILAAAAIPAYRGYQVRASRTAAQAFMMDVASREKQYMLDARSYFAVANNAGFLTSPYQREVPTEVATFYSLSVVLSASPPGFTISAIASGRQLSDGNLSLSSDGTKSPSGKW